ncbi:MAG: hypothetical protein A2Y07_08620 [Planctomycetes bacterium GWF2_50_10]|nr:MAG: hypothetical protein A2Y07_08620 [Planctomycetes bacterium GWF2_50_10]
MAIIVGDIHGDVEKVKAFLAYKPEEEHVALGDYLDSYSEPVDRQLECLSLLMNSESVLLLGNHECHYLKNPLFRFPGYKPEHAEALQNILEANLGRFKVAYAVDNWLCTHSGVVSDYTEQLSDVTKLADMFNMSWELYLKDRLLNRRAKYAYQRILEFNYCLFVEGNLLAYNIKQIFGHVEHTHPIVGDNYIALDTTNYDESCWIFDTAVNKLGCVETKCKRTEWRHLI